MGAGGLQALVKSGLPIKDKRVAVAGSGPLLLAVAKYLRDHGARVLLIAEQADSAALFRFGLGLIAKPAKVAQAIGLRAGLLGVPYLTRCWPISAQGAEKLESVTFRRGTRTFTKTCDYLACGFGLVPNLELASLLGCRMSATGVAVDEYQQSSIPGVYCAGEITGIGGLDLALAEGEIAGYAAAGKPEAARKLFAARDSHRKFADALERAFAPRAELRAIAARRYLSLPLRRCRPRPHPPMLELARSQAAHPLRHGPVPRPRLRTGRGISVRLEGGIRTAAGVRGAGGQPRGETPTLIRPDRHNRIANGAL